MNISVIFAGGVGSRMKSKKAKPKQFLTIHGKPIIIHTLEQFENHPQIDAIVISCVYDWITYLDNLLHEYNINKVKALIPGGSTGQESIYNGLIEAKKIANETDAIVLIHDGVRPLINAKTISDNIFSVQKYGSAITSIAVKETVLVIQGKKNNAINYIPNRENTRLARAPQSFWLNEILEVHQKAKIENKNNFIDSCTLMQYYGKKMFLVDGPEENIKITTPDDFYMMRALLDAKENAQIYGFEE